jgi:hypothetical protein
MANKATQEVGLTFNVNTIRNKMKEYYESQGLSAFQISGGHKAITAVLEKLWEFTLRECKNHANKDKSGMRVVTVDNLSKAVLMHVGLENYYLVNMKTFDSTNIYTDQAPVSQGDMDKVMERVSTEFSLTPKARNLACYLLNKAFFDLARTSHLFVEFAKKKSIDARSVLYTVSCKFHESVGHELRSEVIRAMKSAGEELEDTETADGVEHVQQPEGQPAGEVDDGAEVAAEEPDTSAKDKKTPAKKTTGKNASKAEDKKIDVEDDAQVEASGGDDAQADDTVVEEAKPKVAKKQVQAPKKETKDVKPSKPAKK